MAPKLSLDPILNPRGSNRITPDAGLTVAGTTARTASPDRPRTGMKNLKNFRKWWKKCCICPFFLPIFCTAGGAGYVFPPRQTPPSRGASTERSMPEVKRTSLSRSPSRPRSAARNRIREEDPLKGALVRGKKKHFSLVQQMVQIRWWMNTVWHYFGLRLEQNNVFFFLRRSMEWEWKGYREPSEQRSCGSNAKWYR